MTVVDSLLGHAQVDLALECLGSLLRCSLDPIRLRLRDDGSLTDQDRNRLAVLGEPEIVDRRTADEQVEPFLRAHPASLGYRRRHPLGMKLFDVALGQTGPLHFCDTDVLFLRPVEGLFSVVPAGQAVFLQDVQNAYSLRSWQLLRHRLRIPERINTGLFSFPRERFDLDLAEWYLSRPEMAFAPVWQEQTAWALQAGGVETSVYQPTQFRLAIGPPASAEDSPAGLHFVSPSRRYLPAWRTAGAPNKPVRAAARTPSRLGPVGLLGTELRRRWDR